MAFASLFGVSVATGQIEIGADHFYLYQGQPVWLELDRSRVAIFAPGPVDAAALSAQSGIQLGAATAHDVAGWSYLDVPGDADRGVAVDIEQMVADLAGADPNFFVSPVFEGDHGPLLICPDLLIRFHEDVTPDETAALIADLGLGQVLDVDVAGVSGLARVRARVNDGFELLRQANEASGFAEVEFAEPDMLASAQLFGEPVFPNDPMFDSLWGIHNIGQSSGLSDFDLDGPEAWAITQGDPSIIVAIFDNGVQIDHFDLNAIPGTDLTGVTSDGSHDPNNPCDGHGTLVAGTIGAHLGNNLGLVGIAPDCLVTSAKVFQTNLACDGSGTVQVSWMLGAIDWALNNDVRVTNTSLSTQLSSSITAAFTSSAAAGIVHFAATGNGGISTLAYPASIDAVNAVGAADRSGNRASFSQYGTGLAFMAPGQQIVTTARSNGFNQVSGTSLASPFAAGVAALVLSRNPTLSSDQVTQILTDSAEDMGLPGMDSLTGAGLLNAAAALEGTVLPDPPEAFALLEPAQAQTNTPVNPTFTWDPSNNATEYLLEVDDFSDFSSPEISIVVDTPTYTHDVEELPIDQVFWWRVTASNIVAQQASSERFFRTLEDAPGNFALDSPPNQSFDVEATPTLTWYPSTLVTQYRVRISQNADLSAPAVDALVPTESFTVPNHLEPSTLYHWSVDAINAVGSTTSSPFVRQFTTVAFAPVQFSLLEPSSSTLNTRSPQFTWDGAIGAQSYTLTIAENDQLTDPVVVVEGLTIPSHTLEPGMLINRRRYYWSVVAHNATGSTVASLTPRSFTTFFGACSGDANFDGQVNFIDITSILNNWLKSYAPLTGPGDALDDGVVNFVDVTAVLDGWLNVCE